MFLKAFILCRWPIYSSPLPDSSDPDVVFSGDRRPLLLIDFGQSIDMTRYPPGTTFLAKVKTSSFMCIEMQTDRPWTYQVNIESHSHTSVLRNRNTHTYTYQVKCILKQIKLVELILWMPFFQTDLFGLAGTLHVLLFGQYMKVYQEQGEWRITQSVNR